MRFLHCSDVHITLDYWATPLWRLGWRRWIALLELSLGGRASAYQQAAAVLRSIAEDVDRQSADHLLVTGDLTAYAMEDEFRGAREALGKWADEAQRCSVIPGNHDVYSPDAVAAGRFEHYFGHLLKSDLPQYRRDGPFPFVRLLGEEVAVVGLKSPKMPLFPGLSHGTVGPTQLEALQGIIEDPQVKHRAVLVMVHHAPLTQYGVPDRRLHGLTDAQALLSMLPGPRFAVLHGHIHRRYHHPATTTRPHIFGAGSSTEKGHEGYWLIDVQDGKLAGGKVGKPASSGQR